MNSEENKSKISPELKDILEWFRNCDLETSSNGYIVC